MKRNREGFPAFLLVLVAASLFGAFVWFNARSSEGIRTIIPTQAVATENPQSWQTVLREGFGSNSTPLPTVAIPTASFAPPTLVPVGADTNLIPIAPDEVSNNLQPTLNAIVTATRPPPTAQVVSTVAPVTEQAVTRPPAEWKPPPLMPPINRDPLGRDHYWFLRPVDSNATNSALFSYLFGSDGPQQENPWRVHHGIDMPNPIGQTVRAAGSGVVIWAGQGFQDSPSYGNVIVIQHDFGYMGQPLYTLYAHLSAVLVSAGQLVNGGDPIGLVGNTGRVSGPHVHFEVRLGENRYGATYNPLLWMVPYVGHGVIAGRLTGLRGEPLQDQTVTVRDYRTGLVIQSATTYVLLDNGSDVKSDPEWDENFVFGDIPVGRYEVIVNIDGLRVSQVVNVLEGMTSFVELSPKPAEPTATPTP